ncbi:hypothetical protein [Polaribacter aestuariivivens]|uniref:hypothetical protein n=1 Tax=Polaribacter aestuariivivens TaxID=2304626 RepID=UPI003F49A428
MEQVEQILIAINKYKENQHFSLDIYYDDLGEDFVCKIHNFGQNLKNKIHFRNKKLIDSLIEAHQYCSNNF